VLCYVAEHACALLHVLVHLQVLQLKGFSHAAKDRWVVVAPRYSPPSETSGGVGIVRIMMLVYRCGAVLQGLCMRFRLQL
jgi:hypothetical protein